MLAFIASQGDWNPRINEAKAGDISKVILGGRLRPLLIWGGFTLSRYASSLPLSLGRGGYFFSGGL
jgi:hypothetical protein